MFDQLKRSIALLMAAVLVWGISACDDADAIRSEDKKR